MDGYVEKKKIEIPDGYNFSSPKNFDRYVSHLDNIENHQFEQAKLDAQNKHIESLEAIRANEEKNKLKIELGWVGLCFGGNKNISFNIVGVLVCIMSLCCFIFSILIYIFDKSLSESGIQLIEKIWGGTIPVITLSLGYIFGKKNKD